MTTSRKTRKRLISILPLFRLNQAPYQITRLSVSYRFEDVYFRVQKYVLIVVRRRAWTCSACREQVHGRIARRPELATPRPQDFHRRPRIVVPPPAVPA
jgi:hypothetical protein